MIRRLIQIAPLVLAIAMSAIATERRVLFAVLEPEFGPVPGEAKLYLTPIAWAVPLAPPPPEYSDYEPPSPETKRFIGRYFRGDRRYATYYNGRREGIVRPLKPAFAGCSALGVTAAGSDVKTPAFATNFEVPERTLRNREATAEESAALLAYGRRWYEHRGQGAVKLQVTWAELIDVGPDQEMLFAATISVAEYTKETACARRAIFILAKQADVSEKRVVPQVVIVPQGSCEAAGDPALFGHIDADGDGIDEVVVRNYWIEASQYIVIRRNEAGEWRIAVYGGVAGC